MPPSSGKPAPLRVLVISHCCVVGAYQEKLRLLGATPGWEVHLLTPAWWPEGRPRQNAQAPKPPVIHHVLPCLFKGHIGRHFYLGLGRLAASIKPDLIYAEEDFFSLACLQALGVAKKRGIPFGFFTWENIQRPYNFLLERAARKVLASSSFAVVGNSESTGILRARGYKGPCALVPQVGVDPARFYPAPSRPRSAGRPLRLAYLGRLVREKGIDTLLQASRLFRFPFEIVAAGHGPMAAELEAANLDCRPPLPYGQVPAFLRRADALVLPSRTTADWKEQFGRVLAEAMACGLPCLGSDSGAIPEVVGDGGLIFREGDAADLAAKADLLARRPSLYRRLAKAALRRSLSEFSNAALAGRLSAFLKTVAPRPAFWVDCVASRAPQVSVIIPTYQRVQDVEAAVRSVVRQKMRPGSFEIIVVDDGGRDQTGARMARLAGQFKRKAALRYFWKPNAGPAAARNLGASKARAPILAFLDSDALARPDWLARGLKALAAHPEWAGLEGRVQPSTQVAPSPFVHQVENLSGGRWLTCNLFMRRKAFNSLGGFDERFPRPVREDTEFAFRCMRAGLTLGFAPDCAVLHPVKTTGPESYFHHAREGQFEALLERTHPRLYRRHLKWLDGRAIPAYYLAHYAALPLAFVSLRLAAACLGLGLAAIVYAWCRKRQVRFGDLLRLLWPGLLVPYFRLYWVLYGYGKYFTSPARP